MSNKKKERKEEGATSQERKNVPSSKKPEILYIFFIS
jgi:hypothetical protein